MTKDVLQDIIKYYQRKEKRLLNRLAMESDAVSAFQLRRAIRRNKKNLALLAPYADHEDASPKGDWVTINGAHVLIGEGGSVLSGQPNLQGKKFEHAKSQTRAGAGGGGSASGGESSPDSKATWKPEIGAEEKKAIENFERRIDKETAQMKESCERPDSYLKEKFGETQMTTAEFIEKSRDAAVKWSDEDKLLDAVYTMDDPGSAAMKIVGVDAFEMNRKMYSGESLNKQERAVVQHIKDCAEPLGRDTDVYRVVGKDYVESLLGHSIEMPERDRFQPASEDFQTTIQGLTGTQFTSQAVQSTCVGALSTFQNNEVVTKIRVPSNVPVCMTLDTTEGEIILPAGAQIRITQARYIQPASRQNDTRVELPSWGSGREARAGIGTAGLGDGSSNFINSATWERHQTVKYSEVIYLEMELLGYE